MTHISIFSEQTNYMHDVADASDRSGSRSSAGEPVGTPILPVPTRVPFPRDSSFVQADWDILSKCWFPVARAEDIGLKPFGAELLDTALAVYRITQRICVVRDRCPHRGVPLSMGWVEGDEIICPYHGLRYRMDGRCTHIPAQPSVVPSERFSALMLPAVERYGLVWTTLNGDEGACAIPPFPEWQDSTYFSVANPPLDIMAAAGRQVEGFIDVAHFAWIHHESFADRENQAVPAYKARTTDFGLQSEYVSTVGNFGKNQEGLAPSGFLWRRVFEVHPPFTAILTVDFPDNGRLRIMNVASPISARRTRLFVPVTRNFDTDGSVEDVYAFNAQIFAEDQAIIEAQRPQDLPLDLEDEAHFAADRASIAYRKLLREMGLTFR